MSDKGITFLDSDAQKLISNYQERMKKIIDGNSQYTAALGAKVYENIIKHFEEEKGPKQKWQAWSEVYKKHMDRIGKSGNKILQDNGHLRQSFKPTNARKQSDGILFYNNAKTKTGFAYAEAHDKGGKKLPRRQFMYLNNEGIKKIEIITLGFLKNGTT